jgi:hypothetical protein
MDLHAARFRVYRHIIHLDRQWRHLTPTQQIDFHFAVGLNRNELDQVLGDGLF